MTNIYHGTTSKGLEILEPRKRYTPGGSDLADSITARIYATYVPAYAVSHSFPWSSEDGFDIEIRDKVVTLLVPKNKQDVLKQEICIYSLPDNTFSPTEEEETGLTYHSTEAVKPTNCECFSSVTEAMQKYGGIVKFI